MSIYNTNTYGNLSFNTVQITEISARSQAGGDAPAQAEALNINPQPLTEEELKSKTIDGYKQGIDILSKALDKERDKLSIEKLDKFLITVTNGINGHYSNEILQAYMDEVKQDFDLICTHAQDTKLPTDMRRQTILTLSKGLDVCPPGMAQHIEAAARELKALKEGLPRDFLTRLIRRIESECMKFMAMDNLCQHPGNEIHYVADLFNHAAKHFGLPIREDDFIAGNVTITDSQYDYFEKLILDRITINQIVDDMAKDCLTQVKDQFTSIHPDVRSGPFSNEIFGKLYTEYQQNLEPLLEKSYGPIDLESIIFSHDDDRKIITADHTLIARSIALNLRNAGIINPFKAGRIQF